MARNNFEGLQDALDEGGWSDQVLYDALVTTVKLNKVDMFRLLIGAGAIKAIDFGNLGNSGQCPNILRLAVTGGNLDIVRILITMSRNKKSLLVIRMRPYHSVVVEQVAANRLGDSAGEFFQPNSRIPTNGIVNSCPQGGQSGGQ